MNSVWHAFGNILVYHYKKSFVVYIVVHFLVEIQENYKFELEDLFIKQGIVIDPVAKIDNCWLVLWFCSFG